jgi:dual specificity tyrosine-phosphorylation-regulated kinase 2/3/4
VINQGHPIFPGENEQEQLLCMMEILGVPNPSLLETSTRKKGKLKETK